MRKLTILLFTLIALSVASSAYAGRVISLPFEENFDTSAWTQDLLWVANGASGTQVANGGWSGGAAKIFPPTNSSGQENGTYAGLGSFDGLNTRRLNVRYLMKIGPTYHTTHRGLSQNKHIIVNKHEGRYRGMTMLQKNTDGLGYHTFGAFSDPYDVTNYATGEHWPNGNDPFKNTDYRDQWICIEHEWNLEQNIARVYIWTQDGRLNGIYTSAYKQNDSAFSQIQIIGGYFNGYHIADPNNYMMYDELKIDNQFIGPPEGFLDGSSGGTNQDPEPDPDTIVPDPINLRVVASTSGGETTPANPPTPSNAIFVSDFEEGSFSEWQGGATNGFVLTTQNPRSGSYCAQADLVAGLSGDIGYADFYFGDHPVNGGQRVDEVYLSLWSKFSTGYVWPSIGHKIGLINLCDPISGARQYQVILFVTGEGNYGIETSDIPDWRFNYHAQNIGSQAHVTGDTWEKLKLYVRVNTPGSSNGIIRLWVNNTLKLEYTNLNIRENTSMGLNKLILSSYANPSSGSNGTQYYDDWILSATDPDAN